MDDAQVQVQGFQTHPGEGAEQEVVQKEGGGDAKARSFGIQSQPGVEQEDHIEQQEGKTQMHQDLGRDVFT